jgi:AraC-like DNA-binding protein
MIERPHFLIGRRKSPPSHAASRRPPAFPTDLAMAADALSDVLRTVRLTGATFFDVVARAPWVAEQPPQQAILPKIRPGAEHLISYHVITEGRCVANLIGGPPIVLEAGDVIVFTRGDPHVMASGPGMRAAGGDHHTLDPAGVQLPFFIDLGDSGPVATKLVCGFLACDAQPFNPLLDHLPPVIRCADVRDGDDWLGQFIRLATAETGRRRAGGESVLARLSELMFIEVIRRHLDALPPDQSGWLAGLRDPLVGKALSLLHGDPARAWTIESLAKAAGLSRSVLAERFAALVGLPPMQYLAKWRMQMASLRLRGGNATIAAVAAETGYGSEAAFSRAFKKLVGVAPSAWRHRAAPDAGQPAA